MSKQTKKNVKMINVADKKVTKRIAIAEAFINLNTATKEKIYKDKIIKGDVISVAKTAGILAAKKTSDIIPLCHQIPLNSVEIEIINKSKVSDSRKITARKFFAMTFDDDRVSCMTIDESSDYDFVDKQTSLADRITLERQLWRES